MGLIDEAKHGIEDVREATPTEVRDKAREAAESAKKAAQDAAELAVLAAQAAATAARSGAVTYVDARERGHTVGEAAGEATREAIDVGQAEPELFEPEYASE